MKNQNYKVTLTTKSPVFIGDGKTIGKSEYIYDKITDRIIIFNRNKMLSGLKKLGYLDAYCNSFLSGKTNLELFFKYSNIEASAYSEWIAYSVNVFSSINTDRAFKDIQVFVKDAYGKPYVPGSSLKGALRTVILSNEVKGGNYSNEKRIVMQNSNYKKKNMHDISHGLEEKAFYILNRDEKKPKNATNDIFSGLLIADSEPLSTEDLMVCVKTDITLSGNNKPVDVVVRECIKPGTKITFILSLNPTLFPYSVDELKKFIKLRFEDYRSFYLDNFYRADIDEIISENNIVLGGGAGFFSKTVTYELLGYDDGLAFTRKFMDFSFDNHKHLDDKTISPHTRKATEFNRKLYDIGICEISFEQIT